MYCYVFYVESPNFSVQWLKAHVTSSLQDRFILKWFAGKKFVLCINNSKQTGFENYLVNLTNNRVNCVRLCDLFISSMYLGPDYGPLAKEGLSYTVYGPLAKEGLSYTVWKVLAYTDYGPLAKGHSYTVYGPLAKEGLSYSLWTFN